MLSLLAITGAIAVGVVLPKAIPAMLSPASSSMSAWQRFLDLLPVAILGALTALTAVGSHPRSARPSTVLVVAAAAAATLVWRALRSRRPNG